MDYAFVRDPTAKLTQQPSVIDFVEELTQVYIHHPSFVFIFVNQLHGLGQSFVPMHSEAGEESQVDFGYLGRFTTTAGRKVKVWCFSIVLSHSRYSYHEVVLDQRVKTFIRCHRNAFEYFGGVPRRVKLDNLKAGVIEPNFYEPILQEQYSEFLAHYGCAGVPCRVRKPEHKGKVESGVILEQKAAAPDREAGYDPADYFVKFFETGGSGGRHYSDFVALGNGEKGDMIDDSEMVAEMVGVDDLPPGW